MVRSENRRNHGINEIAHDGDDSGDDGNPKNPNGVKHLY